MTALLDREPLVEVLPRTARGRARAVRVWPLGRAAGYACDAVLVVEEEGRDTETYTLTEEPTDWDGRAWSCHKVGAQVAYDVFTARNGQDDCCDCAGGTYHAGRTRCRHVLAVRAALENGWLGPLPLPHLPTAAEGDEMARALGLAGDPFSG